MAKGKKNAAADNDLEDDFFQDMAKKTGGDVIADIDSVSYFVDTGNLAVNYICSGKFIKGGIPGGKLTEIYGPSSSSKSLFGNNILFGCQKLGGYPILLDTENSANKEFIKAASHANLKRMAKYNPPSLEKTFAKIYSVTNLIRKAKGPDVPIVFIYDSITVSPCERELREVGLPDDYTEAQFKAIVKSKAQPGERAKVCSAELRKLNSFMNDNNITVVILNQVRSKIGVMYGNPETTGGGGNALEFYASCRLRPQTQKKIEKKYSAKKKKILGINVKMVNKKNKTHRPYIESDGIQLLFDKGINPLGGLLYCLLEDGRVEGGKGNFVVKEKYSGGQEVKFKGSLDTNNSVPLEVLLKCPALIDAESEQEVLEYLEPFKEAMEFTIGDDIEESDVAEGEEDSIDEMIDAELA